MGIAERKISYIPKEENMIGYSGDKLSNKYPQQKKSVGIGKQNEVVI